MPGCDTAPVPGFLYGTAWKEDRAQALTELALRVGFRGIDTANRRRHSFEGGVGDALTASALAAGILPLTGTSRAEHMKQDLASRDLLSPV
jgi:hypothetical protein